jgi:chromosome segregation ATPase
MTDLDKRIERARLQLDQRIELEELRKWKSTNAPRIEALKGLLDTANAQADRAREAVESLESERKANAILTAEVQQLKLAEEGAAEAFGVVVQDKRDLQAEVKRLQTLLNSAHTTIRNMSARGGYQPIATAGAVQPPPRKP